MTNADFRDMLYFKCSINRHGSFNKIIVYCGVTEVKALNSISHDLVAINQVWAVRKERLGVHIISIGKFNEHSTPNRTSTDS